MCHGSAAASVTLLSCIEILLQCRTLNTFIDPRTVGLKEIVKCVSGSKYDTSPVRMVFSISMLVT